MQDFVLNYLINEDILTKFCMLRTKNKIEQDCSYQSEALNVPTAFKGGAVITLKN